MNIVLSWIADHQWLVTIVVGCACLAVPNDILKKAGLAIGLFLIKAFGKGFEQKIIDVTEGFQTGLQNAQTTFHGKITETTVDSKTLAPIEKTTTTVDTVTTDKFSDTSKLVG